MTPGVLADIHACAFTQTRPWTAAEFEALLSSAHTHLFTQSRTFLLCRIIAGEAEILTLATDPAYQRQGHAQALMVDFETYCAKHQATHLFLEVAANNAPALKLYAKAGFQQGGLRPRYYQLTSGEWVDAILLKKTLFIA